MASKAAQAKHKKVVSKATARVQRYLASLRTARKQRETRRVLDALKDKKKKRKRPLVPIKLLMGQRRTPATLIKALEKHKEDIPNWADWKYQLLSVTWKEVETILDFSTGEPLPDDIGQCEIKRAHSKAPWTGEAAYPGKTFEIQIKKGLTEKQFWSTFAHECTHMLDRNINHILHDDIWPGQADYRMTCICGEETKNNDHCAQFELLNWQIWGERP